MSIQTLSDLFLVAAGFDKPDCLMHKVDGRYQAVSTQELVDRVKRLATALKAMGLQRGDRVALMAENGPHWPTVDFATLCVGGVLVPIYPTLTSDQAAYVANDCGANILFVEGQERLDGMLGERASMPEVNQFVLIDGPEGGDGVLEFKALVSSTEPMADDAFEAEARQATPDDLATFIYTSGTTGNPKGVMLTHKNVATNVVNTAQVQRFENTWKSLSFLPLSHSFERTVDYVYFYSGVTIAYAESVQALVQNLGEIEPQVFVSVPRIYEKVMAKVQEGIASAPPLKQKIFSWAVGVASEALPYRMQRKWPGGGLGIKLKIADKLVFAKIRSVLGGNFTFAVSGGAPLSADLARFFWGAGIEIYEGYGLSETSPVLTVNAPGRVKLGTVGLAIADTELRIAEDGEILAKGPQIMRGYFNLPEATAEAIDSEGWFHTGDIGEIDDEGYLKITDRKKEIIVNAYGKNVAPAPIENALKSSRFIEQAVVIGDRRKFLSALLVPDFAALGTWAEGQGLAVADSAALLSQEAVEAMFSGEVEAVNEKLARYEQIRSWQVLPEEFTIETGELTPTMKIKRRVINQKFKDTIEEMYTSAEDQATVLEK